MAQLTALDIFYNDIAEILPFSLDSETAIKLYEKYNQRKETERWQIINAHNSGVVTPYTNLYTIPTQAQGKELITKGEQYYKRTYGNNQIK